MTDINQKENKNAFKRFKAKLKKMHLAVTEELILPQPDGKNINEQNGSTIKINRIKINYNLDYLSSKKINK